MSLPIVMYGSTDCDDTQRTRDFLRAQGIPFQEVNIDHNPDAEQFVIFVNHGYRSTPTLVLGEGNRRTLLTEPTDADLQQLLDQIRIKD